MSNRQTELQHSIYLLLFELQRVLAAPHVDYSSVEAILRQVVTTCEHADQIPGFKIYIPRLLLSAVIEFEGAAYHKIPLNWDSIGVEDPRVYTHARFDAGRQTPNPDLVMRDVPGVAGPSTSKWEKSRKVTPEKGGNSSAHKTVTITMKDEPEDVSLPEPPPRSALKRRHRSVSFAEGLKLHDNGPRPQPKPLLANRNTTADSDGEDDLQCIESTKQPPVSESTSSSRGDETPTTNTTDCQRCAHRGVPCTKAKWAACIRCHKAKTRCSLVLASRQSATPKPRGRSVSIKRKSAPATPCRQTRTRRTSKPRENTVKAQTSASSRLTPYVLESRIADLPTFKGLRGITAPIISRLSPPVSKSTMANGQSPIMLEMQARIDGCEERIQKMQERIDLLVANGLKVSMNSLPIHDSVASAVSSATGKGSVTKYSTDEKEVADKTDNGISVAELPLVGLGVGDNTDVGGNMNPADRREVGERAAVWDGIGVGYGVNVGDALTAPLSATESFVGDGANVGDGMNVDDGVDEGDGMDATNPTN